MPVQCEGLMTIRIIFKNKMIHYFAVKKADGWYFDNILELNHHQQQRVLDVGIQLTQIKNMIGNHGLGKPKKCRKCGLYKL